MQVPRGLYNNGNVVTWNQPSSASEDPQVARRFLRTSGTGGRPVGSIFIIQSATGRAVRQHSVHTEEKEVLFLAGTQFQVRLEVQLRPKGGGGRGGGGSTQRTNKVRVRQRPSIDRAVHQSL